MRLINLEHYCLTFSLPLFSALSTPRPLAHPLPSIPNAPYYRRLQPLFPLPSAPILPPSLPNNPIYSALHVPFSHQPTPLPLCHQYFPPSTFTTTPPLLSASHVLLSAPHDKVATSEFLLSLPHSARFQHQIELFIT